MNAEVLSPEAAEPIKGICHDILSIMPDCRSALQTLLQISWSERDHDEIIELTDRLIALDSTRADWHWMKATSLMATGRGSEAVNELTAALLVCQDPVLLCSIQASWRSAEILASRAVPSYGEVSCR
jgi:hypothetical protein